jgi:hypothetical protein
MPTLTLTPVTLVTLGITRAQILPILTLEAPRLLAAHLIARGFNVRQAIQVVELPNDVGFTFTQ